MSCEVFIRETDIHQTILDMIGSDQFRKNIESCAYDEKSDFARGAMFGAVMASLYVSAYAPHFYAEAHDSEKEYTTDDTK